MATSDQVRRFAALFRGYTRAFGKFDIQRTNARGKKEGRALTVHEALTQKHYEQHLSGVLGIGVIPLDNDELVSFAAIDIDDYSAEITEIEQACRDRGLPLVPCRSKSGGVHAYLFLREPQEPARVREKMEVYAAQLGYGGCEIFPKQSSRVNEQDTGNWINLPYFAAEATERYAIKGGVALSLDAFLAHAEASLAGDEIFKSAAAVDPKVGPFADGPPCLQQFHAQGGFLSGARNNGTFNIAVYLRKRFAEAWRDRLTEYNVIMNRPMLGHSEIDGIIKSASKKEYAYRCKEPPINAFCARSECLKRKYGVAPSGGSLDITSVTRYTTGSMQDKVYWGLEINGTRILVTNEDLYSKDGFNRRCLSAAGIVPVQISQAKWAGMLGDIIKGAATVELPEEGGQAGMVWATVEEFLTQKAQARDITEVWLDKPFLDDDGRIYFTMKALKQYLMQRRIQVGDGHALYYLLRERGADATVRSVGGKNMRLWFVARPETPTLEKEQAAAQDEAAPSGEEPF